MQDKQGGQATEKATATAGFVFTRATKRQAKLRLTLDGPSGSGKTFSALAIAASLGKKIALLDTEHGSASKYAGDPFEFDTLELQSFEPRTYVHAIEAAEAAGYDVLIIDSLSHAWSGKGGALEQVDQRTGHRGNKFTAWRDVTPMHNDLVNAILGARLHVIATMRTKTEYAMDEEGGKTTVRKIGLAPIQRDGMEYEFDVVGDLDLQHNLHISKTRCRALDDVVIAKPGADFAQRLQAWLTDGVPVLSRSQQEELGTRLRQIKGSPAYDLATTWRTEHGYASWAEFFSRASEVEARELLTLAGQKEEVAPSGPEPVATTKRKARGRRETSARRLLLTTLDLSTDQEQLLLTLGETLEPPWDSAAISSRLDQTESFLVVRDELLGLHQEQHGVCAHFGEAIAEVKAPKGNAA